MNAIAIEYLPEPMNGVAACKLVPEFAFSPKGPTYIGRCAVCIKCDAPIHEKRGERKHFYFGKGDGPYCIDCADAHNLPVQGPMVPPTLKPRPDQARKARLVGRAEAKHLAFEPFFAHPLNDTRKTPVGTAPVFVPGMMGRMEELDWLKRTQELELPTAQQELRAISLSSSSNDDDDDELEAANYAEAHLRRVPYVHEPVVDAPMQQRIDWEKYILACGQATHIFVKRTADGGRTLSSSDVRLKGEKLLAFKDKMLGLIGERSIDEVEHDRHIAYAHGQPVWNQMTPTQQMAWMKRTDEVLDYLNASPTSTTADDWDGRVIDVTEPPTSGPQELGLHNLDERRHTARYEPNEAELERWSEIA